MAGKNYSAEDITILEGLDAVRLRPGMYIGSTGVKGLHHILWEIVDNAIDEASNGFATRIEIKLYKDGSASVEDNGRGIPTDIHPKTGVSGVEVVFTQLHAGGKFDEHNYSFSGGLHGVGASVTNALSEWLTVEVYRKTVYKMSFHSYYDEKAGKYMSGVPKEHLTDTKEKTDKTGSFIRFKPDASVFDTVNFNFETVSKRLKELAFLNKGLEINLVDERVPEGKNPVVVNYKFDGGLHDFAIYVFKCERGRRLPFFYPEPFRTQFFKFLPLLFINHFCLVNRRQFRQVGNTELFHIIVHHVMNQIGNDFRILEITGDVIQLIFRVFQLTDVIHIIGLFNCQIAIKELLVHRHVQQAFVFRECIVQSVIESLCRLVIT